jgi:hypothetical protein
MGRQRVVLWKSHTTIHGEFHWARMLRDGRWAEKRGSHGIYVWDSYDSMCDDAYRLGYREPILGSFG